MKKLFLIAALAMLSCQLFAQAPQARTRRPATALLPPPLTSREVSGIVKDETGQTIIGAFVTLKSKADTLRTATNEDGIFIFKNVKYNIFNVTAESIGSQTVVKKYTYSDITLKVVLDPIVLKAKTNELNEVKINGTPSIVYKTDTVEYRASDYKVRENATLDELLKKMEGMEVGSDGTLTHQGQQVVRAKLNGKEFAGGSVAQAIQNLPADIIEKVQIVDDYGDMAARTGVKDGDPQKVLNVTTKADRSVGTTGRVIGQAGNDDRYNAQLFMQHINANRVLGVIGNLRNTVTGVASTGVQGGATNGGGGGAGVGAGARGGGSPGTTQSGAPTFNYRDQWSKKVQVVSSYSYSFNNNNSINNEYGQRYINSRGTDNFNDNNTSQRNNKSHNVRFEMSVDLDSANYLQINPTFGYTTSTTATNISQEDVENYINPTFFQHLLQTGTTSNLSTSTNYGLSALLVHVFKKPHRNFSVQLSVTQNNSVANGGSDKDYKYFANSTQDSVINDSPENLLTNRTNKNTVYSTRITYVEPLSSISQIEFSGNLNRSNNNAKSIQDTVLADKQLKELTARDNIYNYTTTQSRIMFNYRYNGEKVNLTLGATAIPYVLNGTKVDETTNQPVLTSRSFFRVIPSFRFAYSWSRTERFTLTYTG
ncbi:MAG TPA: carboxypeptidase regulatory-like domain-containing protein, partial [Mucilaginibacter sp.]|nr:carboxypeptidase regulatory-like domain-containing protein [Mucilaginibacter sp.]